DLKNPLNAIDLHAQVLVRERGLPDGARESATQIRTEARQLQRMILNLLDLSKADEGNLAPRYTEVDLGRLVGEVLAELEMSAESRNVRLSSSIDATRVRADEDLLRRVVANLAENAIRHTRPGTSVTVTTALRDGAVELRVHDQGPGIAAEMRERIFDAFV